MKSTGKDKMNDEDGHDKAECVKMLMPVKDSLDVLSGKWKLQILVLLMHNRKRFKQIQRETPGITAKMLSKELRDMEMNQLVSRTVYDTKPVSVEYEITPYGKTLKKVIHELSDWGTRHRKKIIGKN